MPLIVSLLSKAMLSIAMKLLASAALEDLLVWLADSLAKLTKTNVDDELVTVIKKALGHPVDEVKAPADGT